MITLIEILVSRMLSNTKSFSKNSPQCHCLLDPKVLLNVLHQLKALQRIVLIGVQKNCLYLMNSIRSPSLISLLVSHL